MGVRRGGGRGGGEIKAVRTVEITLFSGKSRAPASCSHTDRDVVSTKHGVTFEDRRRWSVKTAFTYSVSKRFHLPSFDSSAIPPLSRAGEGGSRD